MQITAASLRSTVLDRAMTDLRSTYDDLTKQLSSGKVSDTYGGLGSGPLARSGDACQDRRHAGLPADDRQREPSGQHAVDDADAAVDHGVRSALRTPIPTDNTVIVNGQTRAQVDARSRLEEALVRARHRRRRQLHLRRPGDRQEPGRDRRQDLGRRRHQGRTEGGASPSAAPPMSARSTPISPAPTAPGG